MPRVYGNNNPLLTFKNGSAALVDLSAWVVDYEYVDGDGNPVTQADYANGVTPEQLNVTFVLDFDATGAYEYFWTNAGATGVAYVQQYKAGSPSQGNPKFSGTCTMPPKPKFGVSAGTEAQTFDVEIALDSRAKAIA